ncbi:MAG: hypothetical protein WBK76_05595 [Candidatus Saccharimonadales bacterium]
MIVGPAAIGKSTLMHTAAKLDDRFGYVRSFTTRPDRGDGQTTYRHITNDEADQIKSSGEAITFLEHPTTGVIYGTDSASYAAEINLLDTLASSVEMYRPLPFQRTITISLTADPDDWETWLRARYPVASEERKKRLAEAVLSIDWSLEQRNQSYWLINRQNDITRTAQQLISLVDRQGSRPAPPPAEAFGLRTRAASLLSYEEE